MALGPADHQRRGTVLALDGATGLVSWQIEREGSPIELHTLDVDGGGNEPVVGGPQRKAPIGATAFRHTFQRFLRETRIVGLE